MTFQRGVSGNPAGKKAGTRSKITIAKTRQYNAVKVLEGLMLDTSVEPQTRMQSAIAILFNQNAI